MVLFCLLCGGWYVLSYHNIHFGIIYLSRAFHDHYFQTAGQMLNLPADVIPPMIGSLFLLDLLIIAAVGIIGKYRHLWWPHLRSFISFHILRREKPENDTGALSSSDIKEAVEPVYGPMHPAE